LFAAVFEAAFQVELSSNLQRLVTIALNYTPSWQNPYLPPMMKSCSGPLSLIFFYFAIENLVLWASGS
jgi:hypothetical protein